MKPTPSPGSGVLKSRPSFPAKLDNGLGKVPPDSLKYVAEKAYASSGTVQKGLNSTPVGLGLDSSAVRAAMVRKLAAMGIAHPGVLQAMGQVERHRFVDSALVNQAYEDTSLPIGLGQTISKPNVVARMLELLVQNQALPMGRVLEVGTGCGYQAAVLAKLCREVYSIERLKGLHHKARDLLRPLRIPNLHLLFGDGMLGFPTGAPYAGIIAAAGGDAVPAAWTEQLAVGGRLVAPASLGQRGQSLVVIDRTPSGFVQQVLEPVQFVPLKSGIA
jgi:protein-L-isoaspartate(D-aspartate) O-methyltransferase